MAVADYREDAPFYQTLGKLIGHEKKVIEVAGDYGYRLEYWGWITGSYWPSQMDTNLRQLAGQGVPEFSSEFARIATGADLFVITSEGELDKQPQLKKYLVAQFPVFAKGDGYLIYNLKP
jgi:hypothetical protein